MRIATLLLLMVVNPYAVATEIGFGSFQGIIKVEWLRGDADERRMRLLDDFTYIDSKGKKWTAPKGALTDGASIPQFLWTPLGGPFDGQYREAAVIHDFYCETKTEPWQDVHRIFYYANRASGISELKSKILYGGVMLGGPRWGTGPSKCFKGCHGAVPGNGGVISIPKVTDSDAQRLTQWVKDTNPSLDEIDAYVEREFRKNNLPH
jgi:hypothetical protein